MNTKDVPLVDRITERRFGHRDVVEAVDEFDEHTMLYRFGEPVVTTHYATAEGWRQGDRRPALATDDPAVNAAMGRCASWQLRRSFPGAAAIVGRFHPDPCGFCDFPTDELLAALSWGVWVSRHVVSETRTWSGRDGSSYTRPGRHDVWEHPAWAAFAELSPEERTARVMAAIAATREEPPCPA